MLREVESVRQVPGEGRRRWFTDEYFDLVVWYAEDGALRGFQLCYDKRGQEHAFTWNRGHACVHESMDGGEEPGHSRMSPVLSGVSLEPEPDIALRFLRESRNVDPVIAAMVFTVVHAYPRPSQKARPVA